MNQWIFIVGVCCSLGMIFIGAIILINLKYKKAMNKKDDPKLPEMEYRIKATGEKNIYIHIPQEFGSVTIENEAQRIALIDFLQRDQTKEFFSKKTAV